MQRKLLLILAVVAVVVGLGVGVGWLASREPKRDPIVDATLPEDPVTTTVPAPTVPVVRPVRSGSQRTNPISRVAHPVAPAPSGTAPDVIADWEDKLDDILGGDDEDTNKVTRLFAMFRNLPPEGQEEVAQHLSNLVEDEHYAPLGELLVDATLPESVLDVLMADLLNRPNADKLPLLLTVVFTPNHPNRDEAKDLLELYLDEDYGQDREVWRQKIVEWLKENPD